MKLFINGKEIEFPNELKPMIEEMAKRNMVQSLRENQPPKEDQPIKKEINPFDLLSSLTKQFPPFLEERKPVENIPKTSFDIDKKINDLEQRMENVEKILIKKQIEKEKKIIKSPVKKKIVINLVKDKPKTIIKPKPIIKPTQKKVVKKRVLPKTKVNKKK